MIPTLLEMHALFLGKLVVTVSRYNLKYFELYRDARHQGWKGKALGLLWAMLKWVTCNTGVSRSYVAATMGMATSTRGIHCWPQRKHPVPRRGATSLLLPYPANSTSYQHNPRPRPQREMCLKFQTGSCTFQPCKFLHISLHCNVPYPGSGCPTRPIGHDGLPRRKYPRQS